MRAAWFWKIFEGVVCVLSATHF